MARLYELTDVSGDKLEFDPFGNLRKDLLLEAPQNVHFAELPIVNYSSKLSLKITPKALTLIITVAGAASTVPSFAVKVKPSLPV